MTKDDSGLRGGAVSGDAERQSPRPASRLNVAETLCRKSDGKLFDLLYVTRSQATARGYRYVRMGEAGKPRSARKWVSLENACNYYDVAQDAARTTE